MEKTMYDHDYEGPVNLQVPSARNMDLKFPILIESERAVTVFSRHETADEAMDEAIRLNETCMLRNIRFTAVDEDHVPLTEGFFRRKEEHYEDLVAGLMA